MLKIIEEPSDNVKFILIHNNKKLLPTLKSRCLNFRISLSNKDSFDVIGKLLNAHPEDLINKDLLTYYSTPGKIYNLVKFSEEQNISLQSVELKKLLLLLIDRYYSKNKDVIKEIIYDFMEIFLTNKNPLKYSDFFTYFLKKVHVTKKYNLDEESLFMEFKSKVLNA